MEQSPPYLSIVVTARNDDHGGNLHKRMQIFLSGLFEQCLRHDLDAELIVVEWNPIRNRPSIAEAFSWPVDRTNCSVRIIRVSPELHDTFANSETIPLFQMIAKNVGISRARGEFVLATNIDVLFSDELMKELAARNLEEGVFYRVNRFDVPAHIDSSLPISNKLAYCRENVIRIFERNGTYSKLTNTYYRIYPDKKLGPLSKLGHSLHVIRREIGLQGLQKVARRPAHKLRRLIKYILSPQRERLHTNASGDFTLMARRHWEELRGYPEMAVHAMHLDSLLCYMAFYLPLKEVVLPDPHRIYHIEHAHGWTPEAARLGYDDRLEQLGVLRLSDERFNDYALKMKKENRPLLQNGNDWGLSNYNLPEIVMRSNENIHAKG